MYCFICNLWFCCIFVFQIDAPCIKAWFSCTYIYSFMVLFSFNFMFPFWCQSLSVFAPKRKITNKSKQASNADQCACAFRFLANFYSSTNSHQGHTNTSQGHTITHEGHILDEGHEAQGQIDHVSSECTVHCYLVEQCMQAAQSNKIVYCPVHGNLGPYFIASGCGRVTLEHIAPDSVRFLGKKQQQFQEMKLSSITC